MNQHLETEVTSNGHPLEMRGADRVGEEVHVEEGRDEADVAMPESGELTSLQDDFPEGGRGWWVVAGCSMIAAVTVGWQLVWGDFQVYYSREVFPDTPDSILGFLGSMQAGLMFLIAFPCGKLGDRFGYKRFVVSGCIMSFLGMFFAAFCKELWQFFITQGVMPAIGCGLVLPFIMSYPSQWFKRRRGLATGLVIAGSSLGGGAASLIVRAMLTRLGLQHTLLVYSFIHLIILTTGCLLLESRTIPGSSKVPRKIVWVDTHLFRSPVFWSAALAMFFTCFGYLSPLIYISQYAQEQVPSLSDQLLALPIAVSNFSSAFGRTLVGRAADRIGVANAFFLSVIISGLSQLLIWNFAFDYGTIIAFSVVNGFFGGCFISLASPLAFTLFGLNNLATLSGILLLFNLPGNTAGAALSGAILNGTNGSWRAAISYSGAMQIIGAFVVLYARFSRQPKLWAVN